MSIQSVRDLELCHTIPSKQQTPSKYIKFHGVYQGQHNSLWLLPPSLKLKGNFGITENMKLELEKLQQANTWTNINIFISSADKRICIPEHAH